MDGDGQRVELRAGPGSRAVVVGQSATRIHPAVHGLCTQQWQVHVARGAVLVVLPGPAIPFQGRRYYQRVEVDLEDGAGLIWGDVWLSGRYARGRQSERFRFEVLRQDFLIRRAVLGTRRQRRGTSAGSRPAAAWLPRPRRTLRTRLTQPWHTEVDRVPRLCQP